MQKKWLLPTISGIIIVCLGFYAFYKVYDYWYSEEISIENPAISKVKTNAEVLDLKTIIHESEKFVVQIEGHNEYDEITGSGFVYNNKGDIITNAHVVKDADVIYVRTANAHFYPAAIVGISEDTDIAVIRVPQLAGQSFLPIEKDIFAEVGDEVIALGSPHGFQNTVTLGIISGSERNFSVDGFNYNNVYQISAQITHGNSGGPLINRSSGNVIGINSVGTKDGTIGFSIPIQEVIEQVEIWSNEVSDSELKYASTTEILNHYDPEQLTENAEYLIDYFFEAIKIRDYINAYTLLGSTIQSELSYVNFREDYSHVVQLNYKDVEHNIINSNQVESIVEVTIESKPQNKEKTKTETVEYTFEIGLENDQFKILNMTTP